jgi:hypothetical protein
MILQKLFDAQCYECVGSCYIGEYEINPLIFISLSFIIDMFTIILLITLIYYTYLKIRRKT